MTREEREEALAIMNVIIYMIDEQYDNDRVEKAVDTAIAALKAEPCEDCVSRKAVLDAMSDTWKHICFVARRKHPTKGEEAVYSDMCGTINRVPPVTPKQRTGKWELTDDEQNYRCSCCKNHWISASEYFDVWKYCPNCGAKMEGESE